MRNEKGFTLIELLLVVMIIGFMLAIILPRGLRATTDAKYNLVRQNGAELAAFANDWIEQQILAQDETSTATRANYLDTLVTTTATVGGAEFAAWIAEGDTDYSNWNSSSATGMIEVVGRYMNDPAAATDVTPENTVEEIIDPAKVLRNPFNGAGVFLDGPNDPSLGTVTGPIPGAIACAKAEDSSTGGTFDYYSLIFQGTDSIGAGAFTAETADYHAGMAPGGLGGSVPELAGVRQGVFFTKVRQ